MPPSAKSDQTFSFEIVSCLLAALAASKVTLGATHFALMEKIDGSTTQNGYQHRFRAAKARAKEINDKIASGEIKTDVTPVKQKADVSSKSGTPARSTKRKARSEMEQPAEGTCDGEDQDDEEEAKTPIKKAKMAKSEKLV